MFNVDELYKKIRKILDDQGTLCYSKDGTFNGKFLQYLPSGTNQDDWGDKCCHYEFWEKTNAIKIAFHSEKDFPKHSKLQGLIDSNPKLSKFQKHHYTGKSYDLYEVEYTSIEKINNLDEMAEDAAKKMLSFVTK